MDIIQCKRHMLIQMCFSDMQQIIIVADPQLSAKNLNNVFVSFLMLTIQTVFKVQWCNNKKSPFHIFQTP